MAKTVLWPWMLLFLASARTQQASPEGVLNCCEGDVLFLLDSSGSVPTYEHSRLLSFLSDLLLPFSLGEDQVRVALLQVGTEPKVEFDFSTHYSQRSLQGAVQNIRPLRGDTNTVEALRIATERLLRPGAPGSSRQGLPRVLVWLTDGVKPGDVTGPMGVLRDEGVAVLVVSTGHGNYQVLKDVATPPSDKHLYFVDIDALNIITEDLRNAIIEIIRAERMTARDISTSSATLQWRPVLTGLNGFYEIRFGPVPTGGAGSVGGGPGTSPSVGGGQYQRFTQSADSSTARLTGLKPDTTYVATLTPESNEQAFNALSVTFTTKPEVLSPAVISISELGSNSVRINWGPLQPESVMSYYVEYSSLPSGKLSAVTIGGTQNSTVLRNLQPDTTYLITVSARHSSGTERAMSVKVCTEEVTPALSDLQLTTVGSDSVQVEWTGSGSGLRGYWLTWEDQQNQVSAERTTMYLPPESLSTRLSHLPPLARVCVSPIYRTARGDGLCCTAHFHSDALSYGYQS
ncbi:unnamed protein product [Knipowitschia caucasica]|uniref:von Willebrand factor A domain-containing protein 1 n=1 Tax=Knipowitschia caucasica TaxID=637954 RepID=A0AAV2LWR4_KNICA